MNKFSVFGVLFILIAIFLINTGNNNYQTGSILDNLFRFGQKVPKVPCLSGKPKIRVRPQTLDALRAMCNGILLSQKGKDAKKCVEEKRKVLDEKIDECRAIEFDLDDGSPDTKNSRLIICQKEVNIIQGEGDNCGDIVQAEFEKCYRDPYFDYLRNAPVRNEPVFVK